MHGYADADMRIVWDTVRTVLPRRNCYPEYDDTQITAKVPSQELSEALVKTFKDKFKE